MLPITTYPPSTKSSSCDIVEAPLKRNLVDRIILLWDSLKPRKQLQFHPLSRVRAFANVLHHISARRKIELEHTLTRPFHVEQHGLVEMPPKQLICDTLGIVRISTDGIQYSTINMEGVATKNRDLVAILTIDE